MRENESKRMFLCFFVCVVIFLGGAALLVYLIDPFFHYHKPWFGLAAVQDSKEYQLPGALEHLDYDSVLMGSSVVMSMNTDVLNERYGCTTIKAVGNSAGAPILNYYMKTAFDSHEIKYIFYGLDVFSFYNDPEAEPISENVQYMTNKNPIDDIQYLWNGEIIGRKIPDMIKTSRSGNYTWGMTYNLNQYRTCGPEEALSSYFPNGEEPAEIRPSDYQLEFVTENLKRLEAIVSTNLNTQFVFFVPPYPILWWEKAYSEGMLDAYQYTLEEMLCSLLQYENVEIYTTHFNDVTLITDLYQYMDIIHGGPTVTDMMDQELGNPDTRITLENYEQEVDKLFEIQKVFHEKVKEEGVGFLSATGGMQMP